MEGERDEENIDDNQPNKPVQPPVPARRHRFLADTPRPVKPIDPAEPIDFVLPDVTLTVFLCRGLGRGRSQVGRWNVVAYLLILPSQFHGLVVVDDGVLFFRLLLWMSLKIRFLPSMSFVACTEPEYFVHTQRLRRRSRSFSPSGDYVFPLPSRRTRLGRALNFFEKTWCDNDIWFAG